MSEFGEKVPAAGAKVEFLRDSNGNVAMRISGTSNSSFRAVYQIAVGFDGRALAVVPFRGLGSPYPPYPKPSLLAWIQSDAQGMWGRLCPFCKSYFRTNHVNEQTFCPYCGKYQDSLAFITKAQARYVEVFCNAFIRALNGPDNVTIDSASVTDETPEWQYSEERQQFHFECAHCHTGSDILGDYGWCSRCGRTNARELVRVKLSELETQFQNADKNLTGQKERGGQWERINNACFSEFEALGNHLRKMLLLFPSTPRRKGDLQNLSFQSLIYASECFEQWFGIEILKAISAQDRAFLKKMLHRRHILIHNGGKVDESYLHQSGDTSVRLNERIRIRSSEICRLLPIVTTMSTNLLDGFENMS